MAGFLVKRPDPISRRVRGTGLIRLGRGREAITIHQFEAQPRRLRRFVAAFGDVPAERLERRQLCNGAGIVVIQIDKQMQKFQPVAKERVGDAARRRCLQFGEYRLRQAFVFRRAVRLRGIAHQSHPLHDRHPGCPASLHAHRRKPDDAISVKDSRKNKNFAAANLFLGGPRHRVAALSQRQTETDGMSMIGLDGAAFEQLMTTMRPSLHRYCARMMGSVFEGEDVVQDALMKATQAYAAARVPIENPQAWLFRIAHNAALDALRRRRRRLEVPLDAEASELGDASAADARVAATASLANFFALPAAQRSCVALIDVLGYLPTETAEILGLTLGAVKAGLHRGRHRLREMAELPGEARTRFSPEQRQRLQDYADRFNARDFDALRDLLAEDVRLDLANRRHLRGKKDVSVYFTRYDSASDWRFSVGLAESRLALLVRNPQDQAGAITHVVLLDWGRDRIVRIRDFKYAPYVLEDMEILDADADVLVLSKVSPYCPIAIGAASD